MTEGEQTTALSVIAAAVGGLVLAIKALIPKRRSELKEWRVKYEDMWRRFDGCTTRLETQVENIETQITRIEGQTRETQNLIFERMDRLSVELRNELRQEIRQAMELMRARDINAQIGGGH